jgi:hypothetical protein
VTLVSSIILDAYRESNMLALGKEPAANQLTEALRLYNAVLAMTYGGDAGEPLADWPLGLFGRENQVDEIAGEYRFHPDINRRLVATNEIAVTVYLTPRPQDGARYGIADPFSRLATVPVTLNANGRVIEASPTLVLNTDGLFREWIYRADLAAWLRLSGVTADDENPFPDKFDAMFAILLAMRLNPRYGRTLDDQSIAVLKQGKREFIARYLQSQPLEIDDSLSWPFMSTQSYQSGRAFSSTPAFNRGDVRGG